MPGRYRSNNRCKWCGESDFDVVAEWVEQSFTFKQLPEVRHMESRVCHWCDTVWTAVGKVTHEVE